MAFKLPKYSELTNQQRTIINLPLDKNHVVTGAPGTGKSVIAVYRASDLCNAGRSVLMLVYNRPLMAYISSAVESLDIAAEVNTWHSWISGFYRDKIRKKCPNLDDNYTYDWDEVKSDFKRIGRRYDHIIIDEAQDVPIELVESLTLISGGISCFMDVNQTLSVIHTDYQEVASVLGVRTAYKLYENFRNTKEIFDFAQLYGGKDDADPVKQSGKKPMMIRCSGYGSDDESQLTSKMIQILKRNFGLNYIGVFTTATAQNRTYEELYENLEDMDVYMYKRMNKEHNTIDFDNPGVYVLTFNTMKGLEFDAVLIPRCECIKTNGNSKVDNNMFYVALTRASEQVFCFYFNKIHSNKFIDVFGPIKGNENILDWE